MAKVRTQRPDRIWVAETEGKALVAFAARNRHEALQLPRERWFKDDLLELRSDGAPVWDGLSRIHVRSAVAAEQDEFFKTEALDGDMLLVFLIPLDSNSERKRYVMARRPHDPLKAADAVFSSKPKPAEEAPKAPSVPAAKEQVTLRIDRDVLDYFQADGPGWRERINDALRKAAGK